VIQKGGLSHQFGQIFAQIGDSDKCSSSLEALNVETKTKRTLHSSRRLSFNELANAKKSCAA